MFLRVSGQNSSGKLILPCGGAVGKDCKEFQSAEKDLGNCHIKLIAMRRKEARHHRVCVWVWVGVGVYAPVCP